MKALLCGVLCVLSGGVVEAGTPDWKGLSRKDGEWYRSAERDEVVEHVLGWQTEEGAWPKNVDTTSGPPTEIKLEGTFDNHATTFELRFLARCQREKPEETVAKAFNKGLDHIFAAQYESGGWPQYFPLKKNYTSHVTLNDQLMVDLLGLLRDVSKPEKDFAWVDEGRKKEARERMEKGVDLLLKLQVVTDGRKTIWAAQYDPKTLEPAAARKFEPVSLATAESAGVMSFLATLERTSEIDEALQAGLAWFEANGVEGYRYGGKGESRLLYRDDEGTKLWARFYDIQTGKAVLGRRDGRIVESVDELDEERREGYAWYGDWGRDLRKRVERRK